QLVQVAHPQADHERRVSLGLDSDLHHLGRGRPHDREPDSDDRALAVDDPRHEGCDPVHALLAPTHHRGDAGPTGVPRRGRERHEHENCVPPLATYQTELMYCAVAWWALRTAKRRPRGF